MNRPCGSCAGLTLSTFIRSITRCHNTHRYPRIWPQQSRWLSTESKEDSTAVNMGDTTQTFKAKENVDLEEQKAHLHSEMFTASIDDKPKVSEGTRARDKLGFRKTTKTKVLKLADGKLVKDRWRDRTPDDIRWVRRNEHILTRRSTPSGAEKTKDTLEQTEIEPKATPGKLPKLLQDFEKPRTTAVMPPKQLPAWRVQKEAIKKKLAGEQWDPLKKLSPDAMEGVRQLHSEDPVLWSTANLSQHFEVSPDAIRRILKSNWKPNDEEEARRHERWIKRGETIWDRYVELGYKAPRKWRGLTPIPGKRDVPIRVKSEIKAEEWSQDYSEDTDTEVPGLGVGLANRIM